jgi:uncharacterized protein
MDDVRAQLQASLKDAMLNKENTRRDVIRMALNAVKQVEVDERKTLTNDDVLTILQREVKTRRESIAEAEKAGRGDEAAAQIEQLAILEAFLPRQLSRAEVEVLARDAVAQSGATSAKEMGKIMAILMPKVRGIADGKMVNDVVRELLSS